MQLSASTRNPFRTVALAAAAGLVASLNCAGCSSHKSSAAERQPAPAMVDQSWVQAAESCWPELARKGYSVQDVRQNLFDFSNFRSIFPAYQGLSDHDLRADLLKPIQDAPSPDITVLTNSNNPVLTRGQAAAGTDPHMAVVAATHGIAPPDALCAIQTGTPVGFK